MRRAISLLCAGPLLAASITAGAAYAAPMVDESGYAENVREYSKELVAAVFAVRWCNEYNLTLNNYYFNAKSPGVQWDQKRYDAFTEAPMKETRKKIDTMWARMGREAYCKAYIDFAKKNRTFYGMSVILPPTK
jgi:hypothetical protein